MLKRLQHIATSILIVFAFFYAPVQIYESTGKLIFAVILVLIFALIIAVGIATGLVKLPAFVAFGVRKSSNIVCTKSLHSLEVQKNGEAIWKVSKTLIFLESPECADLRDLISIDRPLSSEDLHYLSPDSTEIKRVRANEHHIAIFWSPRAKIYLFEPYHHSFQCLLKTSFTGLANYKLSCFSLPTGYHKTTVRTPYPVEHVVAFKGPRYRSLCRLKDVCKRGLQQRVSNCPQPRIADARQGFEWEIHTPELGREYFCIFFKQGGVEYCKGRLRKGIICQILRFLKTETTNN